jgi:hypothetical protein
MEEWLINAQAHFAKCRTQLHILAPCYGGLVNSSFMECFLRMQELFNKLGVGLKLEILANDSLVTRARNALVARAMSDSRMTHVIFIDSDIVWGAEDVVRLLLSNKDVAGGVYPKKGYSWENVEDVKKYQEISDAKPPDMNFPSYLKTRLVQYNWNLNSNSFQLENGYMEVKHLATGFLMISRSALETMMAKYPETKYTDDVGHLVGEQNTFAYALFDCAVVEQQYYSEDWLFCKRWTDIGGKIYANVTIPLVHIGPEPYLGRVLSILNISR